MKCLRCHHAVQAHVALDGCLMPGCSCGLNQGAATTLSEPRQALANVGKES